MVRAAGLLACLAILTPACSPTHDPPPPGGSGGSGPDNSQCLNTIQDGDETDVDCGGGACASCPDISACKQDRDCVSGVCSQGTCGVATCSDGRQNGMETAVDCGAGCELKCQQSQNCNSGLDCDSKVCGGGVCLAKSCGDLTRNDGETGVDCGGPCAGCDAGVACGEHKDCKDGRCIDLVCVAGVCNDGIKNQNETATDCGGVCGPCNPDQACLVDDDCSSQSCVNSTCAPASCNDHVRNQTESGVDCGGPCGPCADGLECKWNRDCKSLVCNNSMCQAPTCSDTTTNGKETGTDCGGTDCTGCKNGQGCLIDGDCTSKVCDRGFCTAPGCGDGRRNQDETDLDCGGLTCVGCGAGLACTFDRDCWSRRCFTQGTSTECGHGDTCECTQATCNDVILNADESDVDCGGTLSGCGRCANTFKCGANTDCQSGFCNPVSHKCAAVVCGDGYVQAGEECDDANGVNEDSCSNICKRWKCGDRIVQPLADYSSFDIPAPLVTFLSITTHVCGTGSTCNRKSCEVPTGDEPEHGICQTLGYQRAIKVDWTGVPFAADNKYLHASNWKCKDFVCGLDGINTNKDCNGNQFIKTITCGGEQCDEGPDNSDNRKDACRTNCLAHRCGDAVVDTGEECDQGVLNGTNNATCTAGCKNK